MVKTVMKKTQTSAQKQDSFQKILNAANEGCPIHQFYLDECINENQFQAGLAFAKLYGLAMRSFGIHNRVKTASQSWDQLHGASHDQFNNRRIEGFWRYIIKALDPIYHRGIPMRDIAFNLILTTDSPKQYSLNDVRKTLSYLHYVWEKIETGHYKLGLFRYEEEPIYLRLH